MSPVREVLFYFLRLGVIAFGGPAAHIAIMRRELVQQRGWVTDSEFLDLLGATNLIPGPNSTEMTMHLGHRRAGWAGLWLGGVCFILPAVAITLVLAWAYVRYGDTPAGEALITGIQPLILAVILQAIWGLRRAAVKGVETAVVGLAVVALALAGVSEIVLILGSGLVLLAWHLLRRGGANAMLFLPALAVSPFANMAREPGDHSALSIFLIFAKIGSLLYGSGYVLLAFIQTEFVEQRQWLTKTELVDSISAGQFTPGPVFSTATFVGYLLGGFPGAGAATAGIFLPSFLFVMASARLVPKLRRYPWTAHFLDGVNVAALALMGVVSVTLAREALDTAFAAGLFAAGALVLVRYNPNSAWLVLAGAIAGIAHAAVT